MKDNKGHHVFLERPPKVEGGGTARRRWRTGVCWHLLPCPCNQASWRGRQDTSGEQELAEAREAQQWAPAAATALEECIERLSQSTTRMQPDVCHCSQSWD